MNSLSDEQRERVRRLIEQLESPRQVCVCKPFCEHWEAHAAKVLTPLIDSKAVEGTSRLEFEAKLLGCFSNEDHRIKLCETCLRQAIADNLVIFSSAIPRELQLPDPATQMRDKCVEAVEMAGRWCDNCPHQAALPNADGSCSAYGYNGVDCQPQPCRCRSHNPESQHYGMLIRSLQSLTLDPNQ